MKVFLVTGVCLLAMVLCPAFSAADPFVPPAGKTLLLVGQDRASIARYVKATGSIPGGTMLYTSIQNMEGLDTPADSGNAPMDGRALLKTYPNSVIQIGLYMVDALADTVAGKYDANLSVLAKWLKQADRPVYLRIGYEFDAPANRYDPVRYKDAFRYVVDFLRKEQVRNVAYVWHSQCWGEKTQQPWMDWYPGDDHVDWFGASFFSVPSGLWVSTSFLKLAREHQKPFMICESTPWGIYTLQGKLDFLKRVFWFIKDKDVEAFSYINANWDGQKMWDGMRIGDGRVEAHDEIKRFWLDEIARERYLKASPDLFASLGWVGVKP